MKESIYVSHRDPSIARIMRAAGLSSQSIKLATAESRTLGHTYWDSGARYSYFMIDLATLKTHPLPHWNPPAFGGPKDAVQVAIPPNCCLVEDHYCLSRHFVTLYVRPENAAPLLPGKVDLTRDESIVLAATAGLKASYNGVKDYRFSEAHHSSGITREAYDAAKASLVTRKLLNRAGAITVDGRNAIGSTRLDDFRYERITGRAIGRLLASTF